MAHQCVGHVTHYYHELRVAALTLSDPLHLGDWLHFVGHTTDFVQQLTSLQVDHQPVAEAAAGESVGVQVVERVREHDAVYRVTAQEAYDLLSEQLAF
jgi:putative protease